MRNANSETQNSQRAQLDLSLSGVKACARPAYRRRQMLRSRAAWWFHQMRRAVDSAVAWRPAPPPRAEQAILELRHPTEAAMR
jgi:hypothetical protein